MVLYHFGNYITYSKMYSSKAFSRSHKFLLLFVYLDIPFTSHYLYFSKAIMFYLFAQDYPIID